MAILTDLEDVKSKLRWSRGERVKFRDTPPSVYVTNANGDVISRIGIDVTNIEIIEEFEGHEEIIFIFSSPTEFDVVRTHYGGRDHRPLIAGSGDVASSFSTSDGVYFFPADMWTIPDAQVGDEVKLEFTVHVSDINAEAVLEMVDQMVLTTLEAGGIYEDFGTSAPDALRQVGILLGAYYIYTDVHLEASCVEKGKMHFTDRWKKQAETLLDNYMKAKGLEGNYPVIDSFPSMLTGLGQTCIANGVEQITDDVDELERTAVQDEFFNQSHNSSMRRS